MQIIFTVFCIIIQSPFPLVHNSRQPKTACECFPNGMGMSPQ